MKPLYKPELEHLVEKIKADLNSKQDKLTAGENVVISNNTISATDTVYDDTSIQTELGKKADKTYVDNKVKTDVPENAVFTDTNTTYTEITTAEIDTGTASTLRTITGRRVKYILDKVQGWIGGLTKSDVGLGNVDNVKQASKTEFDEHKAEISKHGIYTDTVQTNVKYKLVIIDEEPFLEVVEV